MSEMEHKKGVVVEFLEGATLEEKFILIIQKAGLVVPNYNCIDELQENFEDVFCDSVFVVGEKVYELKYSEDVDDYADIATAVASDDMEIHFEIKWYNGGAGMAEMVECAINNMNLKDNK